MNAETLYIINQLVSCRVKKIPSECYDGNSREKEREREGVRERRESKRGKKNGFIDYNRPLKTGK